MTPHRRAVDVLHEWIKREEYAAVSQSARPVMARHCHSKKELQRLDVLRSQVLAPQQTPVGINRLEQIATVGGNGGLDGRHRRLVRGCWISCADDMHGCPEYVGIDGGSRLRNIAQTRGVARQGPIRVHPDGAQRPHQSPQLRIQRPFAAFLGQMRPELLSQLRAVKGAAVFQDEKGEQFTAAPGLDVCRSAVASANRDAAEESNVNHAPTPSTAKRFGGRPEANPIFRTTPYTHDDRSYPDEPPP